MNRVLIYMKIFAQTTIIITLMFGAFFSIHAIDGFAIWSKGGGCERELQYTHLPGMLPKVNQIFGKGTNFTAQIAKHAFGLQLIITTEELFSGYNAALYDFFGKRKALIPLSESFHNSIPLQGILDGKYILQIKTGNISIQEAILNSR